MVTYFIFSTSYSKAKNDNTISCFQKLLSTKITMKTMKYLKFFSMVSTKRRISQKNWRNDTVGTKHCQVSPKVLFVCKKARRNFQQQQIAYRVAREILKFRTICWYIVRNKTIFWSASYSACVVYTKTIIHLSVCESDGYLPCRFVAW